MKFTEATNLHRKSGEPDFLPRSAARGRVRLSEETRMNHSARNACMRSTLEARIAGADSTIPRHGGVI